MRFWGYGTAVYLHRVSAVIAMGKHPVPFRTRKLSPSAPMVLRGGPRGRVGHRRTYCEEGRSRKVERPSSLFACTGQGWRLVKVAEEPEHRTNDGGTPRGAGSGRGRPAAGRSSGPVRRTGGSSGRGTSGAGNRRFSSGDGPRRT